MYKSKILAALIAFVSSTSLCNAKVECPSGTTMNEYLKDIVKKGKTTIDGKEYHLISKEQTKNDYNHKLLESQTDVTTFYLGHVSLTSLDTSHGNFCPYNISITHGEKTGGDNKVIAVKAASKTTCPNSIEMTKHLDDLATQGKTTVGGTEYVLMSEKETKDNYKKKLLENPTALKAFYSSSTSMRSLNTGPKDDFCPYNLSITRGERLGGENAVIAVKAAGANDRESMPLEANQATIRLDKFSGPGQATLYGKVVAMGPGGIPDVAVGDTVYLHPDQWGRLFTRDKAPLGTIIKVRKAPGTITRRNPEGYVLVFHVE